MGMLKAGSQAPEIAAADLSGFSRTLSALLAGGSGLVLVVFFKVSCPTCQFTFPFLQRFADHGVNVIGVSQDDATATDAFRERFGLGFPLWLDTAAAGYVTSNGYGIQSVPSLFLIGADGTIEMAFSGFSREDLDEMGRRFGFAPFAAGEAVPEFRPG